MTAIKRNFLRITSGNENVINKILLISFTFLLIQISLTSIFLFLEPLFYVTFDGFPIKENIFLYLGIIAIVFLISLGTSISYKLLTKNN